MPIPARSELLTPVLQALKDLGGTATNAEIVQTVADSLDLSQEDRVSPHAQRRTKLQYELAWVRTYLRQKGLIARVGARRWALAELGQRTDSATSAEQEV